MGFFKTVGTNILEREEGGDKLRLVLGVCVGGAGVIVFLIRTTLVI